MNNNHGRRRARRNNKKAQISRFLVMACLMAMVAAVSIGGTLAWLSDDTTEIVNTFTTTDLNVDIAETTEDYTIVPGLDIQKNPKVTADTDVNSYVFVKVTEANWPPIFEEDGTTLKISYEIAEGWTLLTAAEDETLEGVGANDKVYYRELAADATLESVSVIKDDTVYVSETLTKTEMETIITQPTLTFKAYQIQKLKENDVMFTPAEAWNALN